MTVVKMSSLHKIIRRHFLFLWQNKSICAILINLPKHVYTLKNHINYEYDTTAVSIIYTVYILCDFVKYKMFISLISLV